MAHNPSSIGVVLVHGIGNQRPGMLARQMAMRLADGGTHVESISHIPMPSRRKEIAGDIAEDNATYRITVCGASVQLREAHWAALSHPDNVPQLRLAPYIFRDLVDTVSAAWYLSATASAVRQLSRRASAARSMIVSGSFALVLSALLLLTVFVLDEADLAFGVLGLSLGLVGFYSTYRILRHKYLILRHASRKQRVARLALWFPLAYLAGILQILLLLISAEVLLFFFVLVLAALVLDYLAYIPVRILAELGSVLAKLRMKVISRWVHRLGWVMVILPVHTFLQAVKAAGNLVSIALTEKEMRPRAATVPWFVGVYVAFLLQVLFSEFLIVFPLTLILLDSEGETSVTSVFYVVLAIFLLVYLVILKALLPTIDLILDIGNYHLASAKDRLAYYRPIEEAVTSLRATGSKEEIHILAHSLGTVITYDWLYSLAPKSYPIKSLHTIGSPLNKFWYLDHSRSRRRGDKDCLANLPGVRWTNYWAYSDFISGSLARYTSSSARISNKRLRWLGLAFVSHVRYWENLVVLDAIRDELAASPLART